MKKLFLASAAFVALAAGAAQAQTTEDFSGFYVGANVGGATSKGVDDETVVFDRNLDGTYNAAPDAFPNFSPGFVDGYAVGTSPGVVREDEYTRTAGVRAGYDFQFDRWVFGVVGEYEINKVRDSVSAYSTTPASYVFTRELDNVAAIRARGGYVIGSFLPYLTAGYAKADVKHLFETTNATNTFTSTGSDDIDGYQIGTGVETKAGPISVGIEYLYTRLDDPDFTVRAAGGPVGGPFTSVNAGGTDIRRNDTDFDYHAVRLTAAYRF